MHHSTCSRIPHSADATCAVWRCFHNPTQCLWPVGRRGEKIAPGFVENVASMSTHMITPNLGNRINPIWTLRWNFGYFNEDASNDLRVYQVPRLTARARRNFDDEQLNQRMIPRNKSTGSNDSFLLASWWLHSCLHNHEDCGRLWAPARDIPARLLSVGHDANSIIRICDVIAHMPEEIPEYLTVSHC
jgi:hypothetical protein